MSLKYLIVISFFISNVCWAKRVSPFDHLKSYFSVETVEKDTLLLSEEEAEIIQKKVQLRLKDRLFRFYKAIDTNGKVIGLGFLWSVRVRTKDMTVLYLLDKSDGSLKGIEVLQFLEPPEYEPPGRWLSQFVGKKIGWNDQKKDISAITGATLSSRSIFQGSRIMQSLYQVKSLLEL